MTTTDLTAIVSIVEKRLQGQIDELKQAVATVSAGWRVDRPPQDGSDCLYLIRGVDEPVESCWLPGDPRPYGLGEEHVVIAWKLAGEVGAWG